MHRLTTYSSEVEYYQTLHCFCRQSMMVSDIVLVSQDGETALHKAVVRGRVAAVKILVNCKAAVDIKNMVVLCPVCPISKIV